MSNSGILRKVDFPDYTKFKLFPSTPLHSKDKLMPKFHIILTDFHMVQDPSPLQTKMWFSYFMTLFHCWFWSTIDRITKSDLHSGICKVLTFPKQQGLLRHAICYFGCCKLYSPQWGLKSFFIELELILISQVEDDTMNTETTMNTASVITQEESQATREIIAEQESIDPTG